MTAAPLEDPPRRAGGTLMEMVLDVAGWRIWLWRAVEAGVLEMAYDVWA
jgi:transposase-like protein